VGIALSIGGLLFVVASGFHSWRESRA